MVSFSSRCNSHAQQGELTVNRGEKTITASIFQHPCSTMLTAESVQTELDFVKALPLAAAVPLLDHLSLWPELQIA